MTIFSFNHYLKSKSKQRTPIALCQFKIKKQKQNKTKSMLKFDPLKLLSIELPKAVFQKEETCLPIEEFSFDHRVSE